MSESEIVIKQKRLSDFLDAHQLDGVILWQRNNFAWITGGADNHIANNSPAGVTAIYATRDSRVCLANNIEAPRMENEELVGRGIKTINYPWYDRSAATHVVRDVIGKSRVATDDDDFDLGLAKLPADFSQLRWSLTDAEIARYREGAARTASAIEKTCREIQSGMREFEIAALLEYHVQAIGATPVVMLVSSDERLPQFRHPIPTSAKVNRHAMIVICAEFSGLISNTTRFIHFGPISSELKKKQQAVCNIDASVNFATKPGRTFGEIFSDIQAAYAREGFANQWQFHHQGGSTGYAGREVFANPTSQVKVLDKQAFAWNPSVVGAKCEDTILVNGDEIEVLTKHSSDWPTVIGTDANGRTLARAGILEL